MNDTITLLRESGAMLEGHFLLSSGRHSDRYFQCARLLQYPDLAAAALAQVVDRIKADMLTGKLALDVVVGPALGGIVVAYEVGRQLGLPAFFTERDDTGTMKLRRGFTIEQETRILIAEDVVTTGKSSRECAAALEVLGGRIAAVTCVVDRRAPGVDIPWPLYAAVELEASDWNSAACELCKQGVPFVKPGSKKQEG